MNFVQIVHVELKKAMRVSIRTKIRNIAIITQTVIATPMKVPEGVGCITVGK